MVKYLIVGNGIAGLSAAKEIRGKDKDGSILIISSESYLTYYRVRLTEALEKGLEKEELIVNDRDWYKKNNIDIRLETKVTRIEEDEDRIVLENGEEISYEKLLLATGGKPFTPPIKGKEKEGVFTLRTLEDLESIREYIGDKKDIIVIGGGLLGLEAAWALKEQGKNVTVVEFAPYLLPRQLDEELGKKLEERLKAEGLDIFVPALTKEIKGDERVESIELDIGKTLKADAVIISTGIRANIDILEGSSIGTNKGIVVDENLRTNQDNIFAAGDAAEFKDSIAGLWTTSMEQGKIAGLNMTGESLEYAGIKPFTRLSLKDIKIFSAGDIGSYDDLKIEEKEENYKKIFTRDNKIIGGILFGDLKEMNSFKKSIFSNEEIEKYLDMTL
nr:FAD-dependent oxidoreductase [Tissierella sp.]